MSDMHTQHIQEPSSPLSAHSDGAGPPLSDRDLPSDSLSSNGTSDWASNPDDRTDLASEDDLDQVSNEYDMMASRDFGESASAEPRRSASELSLSSLDDSVAEGETPHRLRLSYPDPSSMHDADSHASDAERSDEDAAAYSFLRDVEPAGTTITAPDTTTEVEESDQTPLSSRLVERDQPMQADVRENYRADDISHWLKSTNGASSIPRRLSAKAPPKLSLEPTPAVVFDELSSQTSTSATPPPLLSSHASTRFSTPELLSAGDKIRMHELELLSRPPSVRPAPFGTKDQDATLESARILKSRLEEIASTSRRTTPVSRRVLLLLGTAIALAAASALLDVPIAGGLFARNDHNAAPAAPAIASNSVLASVEPTATMKPNGSIRVPSATPVTPETVVAPVATSPCSPAPPCPAACALSLIDPRTSLSVFQPPIVSRDAAPFRRLTNASAQSKGSDATPAARRQKSKRRSCTKICAPREKRTNGKGKGKGKAKRAPAGGPKSRRTATADRCFHRQPHHLHHSYGHRYTHGRADFAAALSTISHVARAHLALAEQGARRVTAQLRIEGTRTARKFIGSSHDLVDLQQAQRWADDLRQALRRRTSPVQRTIQRAAKGYGHLRRGEVGVGFSMRNPRVYPKSCEDLGENACLLRRRK